MLWNFKENLAEILRKFLESMQQILRSWAVFVVDDIIVYFLSLFTFRYHFCLCIIIFLLVVPVIYVIHTWGKLR